MQEIKVLVPEDRVPDFYKWFGSWLDDDGHQGVVGTQSPGTERLHWAATSEETELAAELWAKLSSKARALFGHLIDRPGVKFNGEELAAALEIPNGRYGIAGVLAWPGRYCLKMGRWLPVSWSEDEGVYWMEPKIAQMFAEVRA